MNLLGVLGEREVQAPAVEHSAATTDTRLEQVCRVILALSTLWFTAAAVWEIAGPFGAGHVAASASIGIAGENMFRWGILAPVLDYTLEAPPPRDYYCHHPWGIFWTTAVLTKLFGHWDWVCRLPPVLFSAATPPLLYAIARAIWNPVAGAVAACAFVVVPIALAFANFNALEVPVIFGCLMFTWGSVRLHQTWRRRWLAVSLLGLFQAVNSDWAGFVFAACVLAFMLPRGLLLSGRWFGAVDTRGFFAWWALSSTLCVLVFVFYIHQFQSASQLARFLAQGELRSRGANVPLSQVLEARRHWIELSFTPLAIALGKLAAPVLALRMVFLRRELELFPLAFLVMATVQYVVFKQGADVHVFWPHYFAPYFALGLAALVASFHDLAIWLGKRLKWPRATARVPVLSLALGILPAALILPDGVRALGYARNTGGRFDEKGLIIHQDVDKTALMKWLSPRLESETSVAFHGSMKYSWSLGWALQRPVTHASRVPTTPARGAGQYFVADARFAQSAELSALAEGFSVQVFGPFWFVDRAAPPGPIDGFSFHTRQPTVLEWLFVQAHDPIYRIEPDPYATWELREHFGQSPNPPPAAAPRNLEQTRIAHNLARSQGDVARAERFRRELTAALDSSPARDYSGVMRLLGVRYAAGVAPTLSVFFQAHEPTLTDAHFAIYGRMERGARWSLVPVDSKVRAVGMPFAVPTSLWKPGYIYASVTEVRPRPGTERFYGLWDDWPELGGAAPVDLLTVP